MVRGSETVARFLELEQAKKAAPWCGVISSPVIPLIYPLAFGVSGSGL